MENNELDNVPEIRYVNEYRKLGDIFSLKGSGNKSLLDKLILQTFISLVVVAALLLVSNIDTVFTKHISNGVKSTVSWDVDFMKAIDTFSNFKNIIPNAKKTFGLETFNQKEQFLMPVDGVITSSFGVRVHPVFNTEKMHTGIDIDGEIGAPIKAAMSGKVIEAGEDEINGKYVKIENGSYTTTYAHCHKIFVKKDDRVKQGDIIAEVGDTGLVSGPHLHFEILENGVAVDPILMIETVIEQ